MTFTGTLIPYVDQKESGCEGTNENGKMKDRKSQYEKENNKRQEGENLPSPGRNEIEDSNHGFLKTEVFHFGHTLKPPEIKKNKPLPSSHV